MRLMSAKKLSKIEDLEGIQKRVAKARELREGHLTARIVVRRHEDQTAVRQRVVERLYQTVSPLPTRLKTVTVMNIASEGMTTSHQ